MVERIHADERLWNGIKKPFDGPFDALPFFFSSHFNRAWTGRLPADIQQVRTGGEHLSAGFDRGFRGFGTATRKKRVGGAIQDAHDAGHLKVQ